MLNRAQLIDDSFNLARAGKLNLTVPLKLTGYLEKEDDVVPWYSAMNGLDYVLDRMRRSENGYADVKVGTRLTRRTFTIVSVSIPVRFVEKINVFRFALSYCSLRF